MESSEFSDIQQTFPDAELLSVGGSTCDCYRVKLYGKLHFMKEYVDGLTLGTFVEENPAYFKSVQNANRFLTQLLEVVGYLHQHQIVHLDLKPSNILITRIGHDVKLADLGYCYTDTYTDTTGRTDKYAAPEQIHGEQVDARTDIYAIGKLMESLPLPPIYNKVKNRCLKELPAERFQSTEETKASLPSERRRWAWLVLVILGIMLIVGLWLYQKPQSQMVPEDRPVMIEDTLPNDTIKPVITNDNPKPSISVERRNAISNKKNENHQSDNDQLMTDIQKEVERNFAETLDPDGDSLRRSRHPFYSAGVYLRQLNMTSTKNLSVKYPHISKDYITSQMDSLSMILIKSLSNNEKK